MGDKNRRQHKDIWECGVQSAPALVHLKIIVLAIEEYKINQIKRPQIPMSKE